MRGLSATADRQSVGGSTWSLSQGKPASAASALTPPKICLYGSLCVASGYGRGSSATSDTGDFLHTLPAGSRLGQQSLSVTISPYFCTAFATAVAYGLSPIASTSRLAGNRKRVPSGTASASRLSPSLASAGLRKTGLVLVDSDACGTISASAWLIAPFPAWAAWSSEIR